MKKKLNKVKQKIEQIPKEFTYKFDLIKHSNKLPKLSSNDSYLVDSLKREGIVVTSLDFLSLPSNLNFIKAADYLFPKMTKTDRQTELSKVGKKNTFFIRSTSSQRIKHPEIFNWGLEQRLLDIAENYIGLPVQYLGAAPLKSLIDSQNIRARLWHKDTEDRRHIKIIVYFNDVSDCGGPFECISQKNIPLSLYLKYSIFSSGGFIADKDIEKFVPQSLWKSCTGLRGTVIFVDPNNFHRGKMPTRSERLAIIFQYTSRKPKHPKYCLSSYSQDELQTYLPMLNSNKKKYL